MGKSGFTAKISPERSSLLARGSLMLTIGSFIAILETLIAIYYGLHNVPYRQAVFIAIFVLIITFALVSVPYFIKSLLVWHEWAFFSVYLLLFQIGFSLWVYRLGDLRFLAIINAITTITILLSYVNILQSLLISSLVLINYFCVSWYSIKIAGQAGSFAKEAFLSFCLIPSFLLISSAAHYITKKREDLENAKAELEKLNYNLGSVNEKLKKEQMMSRIEMDLASEIQNAVFPSRVPYTSDWDIAFVTKPYGAVSGDFYDFYTLGNTLNGLSLFDVSGHGVAPALITILAKPLLYSHFKRYETSRLGLVLESSNSELFEQLEEVNLYITGLMLRMNGADVEYVNAGHPDLLHFQSSTGRVRAISDPSDSFKGPPIGISKSVQSYLSLKFTVDSGDFLVFYSDGITECKNDSGEQFGIKRLSDAIASIRSDSSKNLLGYIMESINNFTGDIKPGDDITIIVAKKTDSIS